MYRIVHELPRVCPCGWMPGKQTSSVTCDP
ncbi:hypothetical protein [Dyella nitratireducens]